ncbi:hypothetical protein AAHE18_19G138100 [Arachis hypogaea]|uniref:Uncharacterized protein n=1 Tax=Arachis hypogaea TaxID=3818 RepID=A0A6B9V7R5_ARAHY|nr:uncharacterized protein DS421_19g655810 [Arachis hypogaea]
MGTGVWSASARLGVLVLGIPTPLILWASGAILWHWAPIYSGSGCRKLVLSFFECVERQGWVLGFGPLEGEKFIGVELPILRLSTSFSSSSLTSGFQFWS